MSTVYKYLVLAFKMQHEDSIYLMLILIGLLLGGLMVGILNLFGVTDAYTYPLAISAVGFLLIAIYQDNF